LTFPHYFRDLPQSSLQRRHQLGSFLPNLYSHGQRKLRKLPIVHKITSRVLLTALYYQLLNQKIIIFIIPELPLESPLNCKNRKTGNNKNQEKPPKKSKNLKKRYNFQSAG